MKLANPSSGGGGGGGGGGTVQLHNQTVSLSGPGFGTATATYYVASDGGVYNQGGLLLETWLLSGSAASFQVKASLITGSTPYGDLLDTWLGCNLTHSWSLDAGVDQSFDCSISVSIRDASAPNTVRATATITISVENFSG